MEGDLEMKKTKRMAVVLALLMLGATACGKKEPEKTEPKQETENKVEAVTIEGTYVCRGINIPNVTVGMYDFETWLDYCASHSLEIDEWLPDDGPVAGSDMTEHDAELTTYENRKAMLENAVEMFDSVTLDVSSDKMLLSSKELIGSEKEFAYELNGDVVTTSALVVSEGKADAKGTYNEKEETIQLAFTENGELQFEILFAKNPKPFEIDDPEECVYGEYKLAGDKWLEIASQDEIYADKQDELQEVVAMWKAANFTIIINPDGACTLTAKMDEAVSLKGTYNKDGRTIIWEDGGETYYFAGKLYMEADYPGGMFILEK